MTTEQGSDVDRLDERTCPCGFVRWEDAFSAQWHRDHRDHHLATFPDVDEGTKRNLSRFIAYAERQLIKTRVVRP